MLITGRKEGHNAAYLLMGIVLETIVVYLKYGRPQTTHQQISLLGHHCNHIYHNRSQPRKLKLDRREGRAGTHFDALRVRRIAAEIALQCYAGVRLPKPKPGWTGRATDSAIVKFLSVNQNIVFRGTFRFRKRAGNNRKVSIGVLIQIDPNSRFLWIDLVFEMLERTYRFTVPTAGTLAMVDLDSLHLSCPQEH